MSCFEETEEASLKVSNRLDETTRIVDEPAGFFLSARDHRDHHGKVPKILTVFGADSKGKPL